jgi:hypothetical protein
MVKVGHPDAIIPAMPESADRAPKKVFTYDEAARLLPEVRRITDEAYHAVEEISENTTSAEAAQPQVEAVVTRWANDVMNMGIDVKGLWLIDFDNGSGYYCWHYPEEGLQFYHSYEEGFRGRTRIH